MITLTFIKLFSRFKMTQAKIETSYQTEKPDVEALERKPKYRK